MGKGKLDFFSTLDLGKEPSYDAQALKHVSLVVLPLASPELKRLKAARHLNNQLGFFAAALISGQPVLGPLDPTYLGNISCTSSSV